MMRGVLLGFLVACLPVVSTAQEGKLRGGEHEGYTRIVADVSANRIWKVGRIDEGFGLHVEGLTEFDVSEIYDRIGSGRIQNVTFDAEQNILRITSGCDCFVDAFFMQPNILVVDIRDGPAVGSSEQNELLITATLVSTLLSVVPVVSVASREPRQPVIDIQQVAQVSELEKTVVEGLARAASQGLLSPAHDLQVSRRHITTDESAFALELEERLAGLETHTSLDEGLPMPQINVDATGSTCLPDAKLDISNWGDERSFSIQVAQARGELSEEFDKVNSEAVVRLAQLYLYFGFGREAASALSIDSTKSRHRQTLLALAAVTDNEPLPNTMLEAQYSCVGRAALWGFLAAAPGNYVQAPENEAVLRAFKELPTHLQIHFGARLADRFVEMGLPAFAEQALLTASQTERIPMDVTIVQARLATEVELIEDASEILVDAALSDPRITPFALVEYFKINQSTGEVPNPEAIAMANVLRFEFRGTEIATDLATAQINALLRAKNPKLALAVLKEEAQGLSDDLLRVLLSSTLTKFSEMATDTAFLDVAFFDDPFSADPETQNAVSERLIALGFPVRAAEFLGGDAKGTTMATRRYLRAQSSLAIGDGASAMNELVGLTTPLARQLRREAELSIQNDPSALGFAKSDAIARAWREGDWGALATGSDDFLKDVSQTVIAAPNRGADQPETLTAGRELLAQSSQTRDLMQKVLDRFKPLAAE